MTPIRLLLYIRAMCLDPALTTVQIKARIALVKASVMGNPDSPDRGHDVGYYCDRATGAINELEATVPPHTSSEVKNLLPALLRIIVTE